MLNANYLLARLKEQGIAEYLPAAYDRVCMHEFVLSGAPMKKQLGLKTLDLAKRLLDHGFHPPTVYFPLLVDEALLVEPTETETKETLDAFADAIARDPPRGRARIPRSRATRPTRRRCAGSTRPAPPSARSSASRSDVYIGAVRPGLAALVALVLLAAPAPAAASSIVLVRDGDVWLATPDGAFERRLTVTRRLRRAVDGRQRRRSSRCAAAASCACAATAR